MAEVLAHARHAGQLDGWLTTESVQTLQRAAHRSLAVAVVPMPRPTVRSVRIATPKPGAIEACAVITTGERNRALAFRLDANAGRWECTALHVG
jgi:hypothetical protein